MKAKLGKMTFKINAKKGHQTNIFQLLFFAQSTLQYLEL